jgi:hypothetical protein
MLIVLPPVLVSRIVCGLLFVCTFCAEKVRLAGSSLTTVPAPNSSMTCGWLDALSSIVIVPLTAFSTVGCERTLIEQFAPAATLLPHVVEDINCPPALQRNRGNGESGCPGIGMGNRMATI